MLEDIEIAAVVVHPDEVAFSLAELNILSPIVTGEAQVLRRYQLIKVNRNDKLAIYREDLGLASDFQASEFHIPSLWEHTVGELRDIADELRNNPSRLEGVVPQPDKEGFWSRYNDIQEAIRKKGRIT